MGIFSFLFDHFDQWGHGIEASQGLIGDSSLSLVNGHLSDGSLVNPATGLPMIDDSFGGVDVGGSPFGMDIHESALNLQESTLNIMDDHWTTGQDTWTSYGSSGFGSDWTSSGSGGFGSDW